MALTLTCPICGKRNGYEFRYGGKTRDRARRKRD
jgi:sarcosine oxidase subunit delta